MKEYQFMEVSLACSDCEEMVRFFEQIFDAKVIFRGRMMGEPFARIVANGITYAFRQQTDFAAPEADFFFRNHLGVRVADLENAVAALKERGAKFVLDPEMVKGLQKGKSDGGTPMLETTWVAEPLTLESLPTSGYKNDVAILEGPDHLYIELNEVEMPEGVDWF
ncbi:MAG: VOC family protein [Myxococcota bacterium]